MLIKDTSASLLNKLLCTVFFNICAPGTLLLVTITAIVLLLFVKYEEFMEFIYYSDDSDFE